jgi:hypothetical protein
MITEAEDNVRIRYEATTGEDTADWEKLSCAVVICKLYISVRLLELLVVTSCKISINPVTNPNPVSSH